MIRYIPAMRAIPLLTCLVLLAGTGHAQPAAVPVTTDTMEYCESMTTRVQTCPDLTAEMNRLLEEGRHLCERGEVRGGIMRLRRAMLLIQSRGHPDPNG